MDGSCLADKRIRVLLWVKETLNSSLPSVHRKRRIIWLSIVWMQPIHCLNLRRIEKGLR